jgi:uncharacterized protein (DUF305 family)
MVARQVDAPHGAENARRVMVTRGWSRVATGLAAVAVASAAACSGSAEEDEGPPILDPGAPGDDPTPVTEEDIEEAVDLSHNEADVEFMHLMIAHHGQAMEMTDLVSDRYAAEGIDTMATRMNVAQEGEISLMETWLEANVYEPGRENPAHQNYCGLDLEGHHGGEDCVELDHTHEDMQGMLTPEQMDELEAADGEEFDELFVEYMVFHHEGAIAMAEEVMREGEHPVVYTMAGDIAIEQSVEITRLQDIIDGEDDGEEEEE